MSGHKLLSPLEGGWAYSLGGAVYCVPKMKGRSDESGIPKRAVHRGIVVAGVVAGACGVGVLTGWRRP